ncbi:MAG: hypothetical protein AAF914_10655 [Pseudomonadota bacterium]
MTDTPFNVRFVCTQNSARWLVAEAIVNRDGEGRFRAFSAGSQSSGQPHPLALQTRKRHNHPAADARSKDGAECAAPAAPT